MYLPKEEDLATSGHYADFDEEWYLEQYPDVKILGMDPLTHYLWIGAKLGRKANPEGTLPVGRGVIQQAGDVSELRITVSNRWISNTAEIAKNVAVPLSPLHKTFNPKSMNIHWIVQDFSIGSGGHMSIFRMIHWLERFGHKQTIWLQNAFRHTSEMDALDEIRRHFQPLDKVVLHFLTNEVEGISGDIVIATDMWTPFAAVSMPLFKERFYFVQDYEAAFHSVGTYSHLADYTYRMGLKVVCAGAWLNQLMSEKFALWTRPWELAYDDKCYFTPPASQPARRYRKSKKPAIAFYARQATSRRMVEFGKVAFDILHERGVEFHVYYFGQNDLQVNGEYSYQVLGVMPPERLGDLYRNCDIGVVFSATNYSLIPMEMMACGLPVVELDTESTRAIFPPDAVQYAGPSPTEVADAIELLIRDHDRREAVRKGGREFIAPLSWEKSARALECALVDGLSESCTALVPSSVVQVARDYPYKASVIIPTWNAGEPFRRVLDAVLGQEIDGDVEVLVVDSGSTDGTVELVKAHANRGVRLHEIPNEQFQHGRTRNLAASLTSGEFIAVLTQDALPASSGWLAALIKPFARSPLIAGVFGSHLAYPDAGPYVTRDLDEHFKWHRKMPPVMNWYSDHEERPFGSLGWAQWLHYFSDNNAALRRSVWEVIPYPEVDWGEDQVWAWEIIKQGYKKAYADEAAVFHSHNDSYDQRFRVAKSEGELFFRYFGYSFEKTSEEVRECVRNLNVRDYRLGVRHGWDDADILRRMEQNEAAVRGHFAGRADQLSATKTAKFYRFQGSLPEPFVRREWARAAELLGRATRPRAGLPDNFDARFYLLFNPDLLTFDCDPYAHYLLHGQSEGRHFS